MNKIIIFLCFISITAAAQQPAYFPGSNTYATIADLRSAGADVGLTVEVSGYYTPGDGGGGRYTCTNIFSLADTVPGHIIRAGTTGMIVWYRNQDGNYFDYRTFGGVGDGVTYNKNLQKAIDYVATYRGTLYIPAGKYLDTSHAMWKTGCNILGESMYGTQIINNIQRHTGIKFGEQVPLRIGAWNPRDWDTGMNYIKFDSVIAGGTKVVVHGITSAIQAGMMLFFRGDTYWTQNSGVLKYIYVRESQCDSVNVDTIYLNKPLDSMMVHRNMSWEGNWKNPQDQYDVYGIKKQWIKHSSISNLSLISYGPVALGNTNYACSFNNIYTFGESGLSGNGQSWCSFNNTVYHVTKKGMEFSVGSHDTKVTNPTIVYVPPVATMRTANQPGIKLGENVENISITGLQLDMGNSRGVMFRFGTASRCKIQNFTAVGMRSKQGIILACANEVDDDDDDDDSATNVPAPVNYNIVSNGTMVMSQDTGVVNQFIYYNIYDTSLAALIGNNVSSVTFAGRPATAVKYDGKNNGLYNNTFQNGKLSYGNFPDNGLIAGGILPSLEANRNMNVKLVGVKTETGVVTDLNRINFNGLEPPTSQRFNGTLWAKDSTSLFYKKNSIQTIDLLQVNALTLPTRAIIKATKSTTSATMHDVDSLIIPFDAAKRYELHAVLFVSSATVNGVKVGVNATGGAIAEGGYALGSNTSTTNNKVIHADYFGASLSNFATFVTSSNGTVVIDITFTSVSAGNVKIITGSNTEGDVTSIDTNSWIVLQQIQ